MVEHLKSISRVLGSTLRSGRRKRATLVLVSAVHILKMLYTKKQSDAGISMAPAMDNTQIHEAFYTFFKQIIFVQQLSGIR